jgi:hypothetical protein
MKRNTIILIAVLILGAITVYLVMNSGPASVAKELRDFAYTDTAGIDKIFLADKTGKQVTLVRNTDGTWTVNEKFIARQDAINNLLATAYNLSVREPVGAKAREGVIKNLITGSVKCELYSNGELKRLYFVGGETPDMLGTYMLLADPETQENSSEPFIMEIKGFNGYLTTRYSPDEKEWRDKAAFRYYVPDIRSVKVEHADMPDASFIVMQSPNMQYGLQSADGKPLPFDTAQVRQYISYFIRLGFTEFHNDFSKKDSVMASQPAHIITVQDASGKKNVVKFYHKSGSGVLGADTLPGAPRYDVDNMWATVNDGKDFVLVQYYVFGKLLQTPAYFARRQGE